MMTATECPSAAQLKAVSLGHLNNEESDLLFQHIADCPSCRSELETIEDSADSLIGSLRAPDTDMEYEGEADCQLAVVKALGALAALDYTTTGADELMPKAVGEYEIVRPLGRGGMGSVYLARHTKLGREVALKILASHRMAEPRMRERFEAEMRAVGRLSHPNIVTAHDARDVDGMAVLVTEYVSGMDLGQLLQRVGRLDIPDACEIARQVALALMYTQNQGFVHRDIKPSNVMLSEDGEIKVLDLGLARLQNTSQEANEITHTGQALGTADYVAPEQVTDSRTVDIRADIYALGCTLFKLLTGRAPFADERHLTAFAKMTAHVSTPPPSLAQEFPEAPSELVQLADSMLKKSPEARPQTPQDVAERLLRFCDKNDLRKLSERALQLAPSGSPNVSVVRPQQALVVDGQREYPRSVVIATGFLGVLLGLFLSIILIITNPDGTRSILKLADGSRVEFREDDAGSRLGSELKASAEGQTAFGSGAHAADILGGPLAFGVLATRDSITPQQLDMATQILRSKGGLGPVPTPHGVWYTIADDVDADISVQHDGKRYALVSDQNFIAWPDVHGHVTTIQFGEAHSRGQRGESHVDAQFDLQLADRMRLLSRANIGRKMALIVHNQIRSAPLIQSEVGENVMITGIFEPGELQQLKEWLFSGLVYPLKSEKKTDASPANPSLDGLWRVVEASAERNTGFASGPFVVVGIDGDSYFVTTRLVAPMYGQLEIPSPGRVNLDPPAEASVAHETIEGFAKVGIYRFLPNGLLQILANKKQNERPRSFADEDAELMTLERIGDFPKTPGEWEDLLVGEVSRKYPELRSAIEKVVIEKRAKHSAVFKESTVLSEPMKRQVELRNNLKQIGLAFHNFHDVYRKFPGTKNTLEGGVSHPGKKTYPFSWRVAILPFIEQQKLYEQYRFDEPWDSENNSKLLDKMPEIYRSPFADENQESGTTNFFGIANEDSALGTGGGEAMSTFTDGAANTLLVVEANCWQPWTAPIDLPSVTSAELFEDHPLHILMADGAITTMDSVDWDKLQAMESRASGD